MSCLRDILQIEAHFHNQNRNLMSSNPTWLLKIFQKVITFPNFHYNYLCIIFLISNLSNSTENDTIQLFEQHGIKLLPVDQSTIIASALKRGQTAVLTGNNSKTFFLCYSCINFNYNVLEAGKLALKKTEPNIRRIANMSNKALISEPPAKKQKPEDENNDTLPKNTISVATTLPKVDRVDVPSLNKAKIIKIDAKQLVNLTANKKLIISKPKQLNPSPVTNGVLQVENVSEKIR